MPLLLSSAAAQEPVILRCNELTESSGVAASSLDDQVVWTHNDSGDSARIFAFNRRSGEWLAEVHLAGIRAIDWEDMCSFEWYDRAYLAVGDIGDNRARRDSVCVYVFQEPVLTPGIGELPERKQVDVVETLRIRFPDGPVDCEALAYDPLDDSFILATKEPLRSRVFRVPWSPPEADSGGRESVTDAKASHVAAELLGALPLPLCTAADISRDGNRFILASYGPAYLLQRTDGQSWREASSATAATPPRVISLPLRKQGEAIGFVDRERIVLTSEFAPTPLWTRKLPTGAER